MEQAIKKAESMGYLPNFYMSENMEQRKVCASMVLLDPIFWETLFGDNDLCQWHNFIDHCHSGQDTDSFFKELLSGNK